MALSIDQMDLTNNGFDVGIVMQRDTVRRPVGDVGNAKSFPFPVLYRQVHDATVLDLFDPGIALAAPEPWVAAARDLGAGRRERDQRRVRLHGDTPAGHGCRSRRAGLHFSAVMGALGWSACWAGINASAS